MQDVVLGLASSVNSSTQEPQESVEPNITAAYDQHVYVGASQDSVAAAGAQNVPGNSSSFSSVPLGALVDARLKEIIWSRQYVDLAMLTGDSSARYSVVLDAVAESSSWHLKERSLKKIDTIGSWTDAFLICMAIYVDSFPSEVAQMLKYMQLVRGMASGRSNMFLHYDRDFRQLRAANAMNWDVLHQVLYLSLSIHTRPFSGGSRPLVPRRAGGA